MKRYTIAGGDDGCYGPRFGPIFAKEVGVFGSESTACLVIRLAEPVQEGSEQIQLLALRPRYSGVTFQELQTKGGTVGVSLVLPCKESSIRDGLSTANGA
jgi:hypothetical protein